MCITVTHCNVCDGIMIPVVDGNKEMKQWSSNKIYEVYTDPTPACVYRKRGRRNQYALPTFRTERVPPLFYIL
jgi:hypothetical protein